MTTSEIRSSNIPDAARIHGCLLAGAIGDAFGFPLEFDASVTPDQPKLTDLKIGLGGVARYSDDTQMTLAVARGLEKGATIFLEAQQLDNFHGFVADEIKAWHDDPTIGSRAPGLACLHGAQNLKAGVHWLAAGKLDAKGCGAVMRSAPYGLLYPIGLAADLAALHANMTHRHSEAEASSAAMADCIAAIMAGQRPKEAARVAQKAAWLRDANVASKIDFAIRRAVAKDDPVNVLNQWLGWTGDEAIAASIYAFVRWPRNLRKALTIVCNSPGDSDSLGSITGQLIGAYVGFSRIPARWTRIVEGHLPIAHLGVALSQARVEILRRLR